ncbi:hypothetical protein HPB50_003017 [Hyalomma asiaticum]|uniref:Uncharacterized protein n=1 Tax=Hyalomma asiaticum TaxID=266040 RepID=A0ACB7T2T6_HYAAI|nr:hypothetical protein HPB50_003017 [Hyalomma asiaticum]
MSLPLPNVSEALPLPSPVDTSTDGVIPKRPGKRNVKAKLSFRSRSTGNSSLPCHQQADLMDALLRMSQKGEGGEHRSDLNINATEETGPTKATTIHGNCETESACSTQPMAEDGEVATSTVADTQSNMGGDGHAVRIEHRKGFFGHREADATKAAEERPFAGARAVGSNEPFAR